ncbi:hypothetical protein [Streptomyces sp. NPDC003247]|uniref:hypothetical protein n=1 Tax=Streptomyces sp. NPDC003247 TaxID=3364677 RepID=UPI00367E0301
MAVDLSFYKSYLSEEIRDEGRADALLLILEQRGLRIPDDARRRITSCHDTETLRTWLSRAITAPTTEAIFGQE